MRMEISFGSQHTMNSRSTLDQILIYLDGEIMKKSLFIRSEFHPLNEEKSEDYIMFM